MYKWYWVELVNGEKFLGSPRLLNNADIYDFWYIDYTTIKSRWIPVADVKSMTEAKAL
jgi:hypothetical protein